MTTSAAFTWLVHSFVASTLLLALCALAMSLVRQPADRLRLMQWSLAATLAALVLLALPRWSLVSLGLLGSADEPQSAVTVTAADHARPATSPQVDPAPLAIPTAFDPPAVDAARTPLAEARQAELPPTTEATTLALSTNPWAALAQRTICALYLFGASVFLVRWGLAWLALTRLMRGAQAVPQEMHAELARIAGSGAQRVRLLASPQLSGPATWGTRRPVILIPASALDESDPGQLRYYLAHEWGHVSRRDFATWQFTTLLQALLFYQPLMWWVRHRLSLCMDQLADADASDQGESTADYAEFLIELARRRMAPHPQLSLGINGRKSGLYQRVMFLINTASRPRPICPRGRSLCIGLAALFVAGLVSVVRLDAEPASAENETAAEKPAEQPAAAKPLAAPRKSPWSSDGADGSITYFGVVTDAVSGKPIPGVKIQVHHKESEGWTTYQVTDHESDAEGRYSFVIPPKEAAIDMLYIEVEAHHPNFASQSRSGYSHAMIRKNLELGEDPFYSQIKLWPGEAITGTIVSPAGEPLADVEVSIYSKSKLSTRPFGGAWDKVKTDAQGVFRIVPATPGDGVLWIKPAEFAPQAHRIAEARGDRGRISMEKGMAVTGRVLDVQGTPVANVKVEVRRKGDGEKADEFLNQNAVAGQIGRQAVTSETGEFALAPLPAGEYDLHLQPNGEGYHPKPLEQVFLRSKVTIADGTPLAPLEIRAVPHVIFHGTYFDSADKPRRGHEVRLFGRVDGNFYFAESTSPGADGKFEIRVPHGVEKAQLDISTNEHSAIRWRMKHDQPLHHGRNPEFGTLEDDYHGFEIIRYHAPIVLVKPVDEQGEPLKDCEPLINYTRNEEGDKPTVYVSGSHVSFEKQQDGRWRSEQLLPDEPFKVTVKKNGYRTTSQELSMGEGKEQSLTFVMTKDPDQKPDEKTADEAEAVFTVDE